MESLQKPQKHGGIYNYFEGATIHNLVINGNMNKSGTEHYHSSESRRATYSDDQIALALSRIVGKGKPIDNKQKWAGAMWLLRWECDYPSRAYDFCERIKTLPFPEEIEIACEYNNIRPLSTLSFMNEDPRQIENVKYSKNDENVFFQLKNVVNALQRELRNSARLEE